MFDWLIDLFNRILSLFDIDPVSWKPVTIGAHCYMPLFLSNPTHGIMMTWNYLGCSDDKKRVFREGIKAGAKSGETPAICFCLTPAGVSGGLMPDNMIAVGDTALDVLETKCQELVKDGIAVFPCLYVDDAAPRWFEIERHKAIWARVHDRIAKYVTGYILSIETNEAASNVGHIEGCINVMRAAMPGATYYGTHLQWTANNGRYSWRGVSSLPSSANVILAEYTWDPHKGDAISEATFKAQCDAIQANNPGMKIVHHEFNVNSMSNAGKRQTEILRQKGVWGVASLRKDEAMA